MYATHASVGRLLSHMSPFRKSRCAESGDTNTCNKIICTVIFALFPLLALMIRSQIMNCDENCFDFFGDVFQLKYPCLACRAHDDYSAKMPTYRNIQIHHLKWISWVVSCFNSNLITLSATQRGSGKVGTIFLKDSVHLEWGSLADSDALSNEQTLYCLLQFCPSVTVVPLSILIGWEKNTRRDESICLRSTMSLVPQDLVGFLGGPLNSVDCVAFMGSCYNWSSALRTKSGSTQGKPPNDE